MYRFISFGGGEGETGPVGGERGGDIGWFFLFVFRPQMIIINFFVCLFVFSCCSIQGCNVSEKFQELFIHFQTVRIRKNN